MPFDWRAYLDLAQTLAQSQASNAMTEAAQRTAVSRAYYAVFGWTRYWAVHLSNFTPTGRGSDHVLLRQHLQKMGKGKIASSLNKLRMWRNHCDYQDHVPNLGNIVQTSLQLAQEVIQEVSQWQK